MRINARLDQEHIKKLEVLKSQEHLTTTEVVKKALDYYYEMRKENNKSRVKQLLDSDFIGCGEGPEDLSENYKDYLTQSLSEKYDLD